MTHDPNPASNAAKGPIDKAHDAMGAHSTNAFLKNAVASNCYEIEAAQIALARSSSEEVRSFAQQMLKDHQTLGAKMRHTLAGLGDAAEVDQKLDNRRKGMIDNLRDAPAEALDQRYLDQQLAAHREAVTHFRGYAENGDHPQVKAMAAAALPILETHLDHATRLRGR